jgi:ribulose-5-phosphate 4-epimerase/fuculose-1-phosphate aldolase
MNNADREARIDLAAAHRLAVMHDLHEGVCNHFTLAPPEADDRFLVIAHGLHWTEVTASNLLLVNENREVLEGDGEPETSAFFIHGRIHHARPDARCVLHTHMPYATALSMIEGGRLEPAHQTALRFRGQVAYDDSFSGLALDAGEGDRLAAMLGDATVLFLANHGVIVVGPSVAQAYDDL